MTTSSFLGDMIQTIAERGKRLLDFPPRQEAGESLIASIEAHCEALLSSRGEASGVALAKVVLDSWRQFDAATQHDFMRMLAAKFGPRSERLEAAIEAFRSTRCSKSLHELHLAAEPRRQELIRRLNLAPNGTAELVAMREVLLRLRSSDRSLDEVDADFAHLFGSWFNRGFLVLRPIDWSTPANILEKVIRYEAVHQIDGWDGLRHRLAPSDRRCYAFFHPQLADNPLIFVEVALTDGMPSGIAELLSDERETIPADRATTAVFYSISNCQGGLRGISFGNFLIKQVVEDLRRELPGLDTFVTLSPVPGFAAWLARERRAERSLVLSEAGKATISAIDDPAWSENKAIVNVVQPVMMAAAAGYLLKAKTSAGRPLDPVARFHLGNGARLERINFLADRGQGAMSAGHGLMVNYLYKLDDMEANHEAFAGRGEVVATRAIRRLIAPSHGTVAGSKAAKTSAASLARKVQGQTE